jgi:hypothetical protein
MKRQTLRVLTVVARLEVAQQGVRRTTVEIVAITTQMPDAQGASVRLWHRIVTDADATPQEFSHSQGLGPQLVTQLLRHGTSPNA